MHTFLLVEFICKPIRKLIIFRPIQSLFLTSSQPRAVTNDACTQTPTRGCLQKDGGVSIGLAEGVPPEIYRGGG